MDNIFDDFLSVSSKQWKQKIQFDLNGADYNQTVSKISNEGIIIKPFYTKEDTPNQSQSFLKNENSNKANTIFDIIGNFAKNGNWEKSQKDDINWLKEIITNTENKILIDTSVYQNAGANCIQQLSYGIAIANDYMKFLGKNIVPKLHFKFGIGNHFFFEIAKLNTAYLLWEWFLQESNLEKTPLTIISTPSLRNKKGLKSDEIKISTEYISSLLGSSTKFSSSFKEIENNIPNFVTQGTYYLNYLSEKFTQKSIDIFNLIKKNGGFTQQLQEGIIQRKIKEAAQKDNFEPKIIKNIRKTIIEPIPSIENYNNTLINENISKINNYFIAPEKETYLKKNNFEHASGFPPFLRGTTSTMYTQHLWENKRLSKSTTTKIIINIQNSSNNNLIQNLTEAILKGLAIIKKNLNNNNTIDEIASNFIFNFKIQGFFFEQIAKLRASRVIWAKTIKQFNPKKNESMVMHIHCSVLGENITEKTTNTLSAIFGGTQSLETETSIHQYLKNETEILRTIDPWGGCYIIENLTESIIKSVWKTVSKKI